MCGGDSALCLISHTDIKNNAFTKQRCRFYSNIKLEPVQNYFLTWWLCLTCLLFFFLMDWWRIFWNFVRRWCHRHLEQSALRFLPDNTTVKLKINLIISKSLFYSVPKQSKIIGTSLKVTGMNVHLAFSRATSLDECDERSDCRDLWSSWGE